MERIRNQAGVDPEAWHTYSVGQSVLTIDGYPGVITAVSDGPHPRTESYTVVLDDGLGGGEYRVGDIVSVLEPVVARRYSGVPFACDDCGRPAHSSTSGGRQGHTMLCDDCRESRGKSPRKKTAARPDLPLAPRGTVVTAVDDYPELDDILWERPDLLAARPSGVMPGRVSLGAKRRPWQEEAPNPVSDAVNDPNQPWWFRKIVGPAVERFNDHLPPGYRVTDVERIPAPNWCRFRRDRHCFLARDLDVAATEGAGYQVWVPYDRGLCTRDRVEDQRGCPVGEPGPDSGEKVFFPDATIPWSQGGQRKTSAWVDVRDKASRIRRAGQVRVIAYTGNSITAEVKGDHNIYTTTITRVPGTKQTALWHCTCPWNTYSWARSGRWKSLEGRMCAHALAVVYEAQTQEMFGGTISEQSATPIWRTTDPVEEPDKVPPAPWRLDVAASLRPEAIAFALTETIESLLAAEALLLADPKSSPGSLERVAQALDAARVDAAVVAGGGSLGDVVASTVVARTVEPFSARDGGRIVRVIEIANGVATFEDGSSDSAESLVYPTFDPTIGLMAAKTADANKAGVMVAFSPSREVCERLSNMTLAAGYDAEVPEQIHLTIAYLGKTKDVDRDAFLSAVKSYAAQSIPMEGTVAGLGTFANEGENVLWASASVPGLDEFRVGLLPILDAIGSPAKSDYGYTPHITLAYAEAPIVELPELKDLAGTPLRFTTLVAAYGGEWHHFDLTGSSGETVAVEKLSKASARSMPVTKVGPLYHGTTTSRAADIVANGFIPNADRQGVIYFAATEALAEKYAKAASGVSGEEPAIVRVDAVEGVSSVEVGYLDFDKARAAGADYSPMSGEIVVLNVGAIKGKIERIAKTRRGVAAAFEPIPPPVEPVRQDFFSMAVTIDGQLVTRYVAGTMDVADWAIANNLGSRIQGGGVVAFREDLGWGDIQQLLNQRTAILHDEPEAALPVTYGSDEDDWAGQTDDLDTTEMMRQSPGETVMHTGQFAPGDARLGWLMNGASSTDQDSSDIAKAAQAFLSKTALKDFSAAEQKRLIDEGEGEQLGARNDDRLDIEGTFYAAMTHSDNDNNDSLW